nr:putative capsid protein [Crucivirus sp.]
MARTGRARGYHYVRMANGRKRRVYNTGRRGGRRQGGYRKGRRGQGRPSVYSGYGAYRAGRGRTRAAVASRGGVSGRMLAGRTGNLEAMVPKIKNSKGGVVRIQHTEYLFDVLSTQGFTNNAFTLNPGLNLADGGFNVWLNTVAANFEEYKARGICFHFKSTSAEVSTAVGGALGTVSMATNYNVANPLFTSKQVMENYEGCTSTKPSKNMNHFVECSNKQTPVHPQYIRTGPVPAGTDARMYDLGVFQIATNGMQPAANFLAVVGELWVSYEFDFFKPRINPQPDGIWDHFQFPGAQAVNATLLPASPFSTTANVLKYASSESTAGGMLSMGGATTATCQTSTGAAKDTFLGGVNVNGALAATQANTYYFPLDAPIGSVWYLSYSAGGLTAGADGAFTYTAIQSITGSPSVQLNVAGFHAITGTQQNPGPGTAGQLDAVGATGVTTMKTDATVTILTANAGVTMTSTGTQTNNGGNQFADFWAFQLGTPVN